MNRSLVLYKSHYGYTKTYAEMIAEELSCDIREAKKLPSGLLDGYDTIIYGGGLYASGINGIQLIRKNPGLLETKNVIVWATGMSPGRPSELTQLWNYNLPAPMLEKIHTFYLRGGFDYGKLSPFHKLMMNTLRLMLKSMKNVSPDQEDLLKAYHTPVYYCDRENIRELVSYVKSLDTPG